MTTTSGNSLGRSFEFSGMMLDGLLQGFGPDDYTRQFEQARVAHWQIGHLAHCRRLVQRMLGAGEPLEHWETWFGMESSGKPMASWPDPEEIVRDFHYCGRTIADHLRTMTQDQIEQPQQYIMGDEQVPMQDNLLFMCFHESYHIGQVGYIRSLLGLPYIA